MAFWRKRQGVIVSDFGGPVWVEVPARVLPGWTMCMLHPEDQKVYRVDEAVGLGAEEVYVMVKQTW